MFEILLRQFAVWLVVGRGSITMPADFGGVWLKMRRAQHHLDDLREQLRVFVEQAGYGTFHGEYDAVEQCHVFTYHGAVVEDLPPDWGVVLGDVLHNARSALDHAVWQLVLGNGQMPGRHNAFPICLDESDWNRSVAVRDSKRALSPLAGISPKCWTAIRDVQPWTNPSPHHRRRLPLAVLARFNNTDKHRIIHGSVTYLADRTPTVTIGHPAASIGWVKHAPAGTVLKRDTKVAWVQVRVPPHLDVPDAKLDLKLDLPVSVAFGEPGAEDTPIFAFGALLDGLTKLITELMICDEP